MDVQQNAPEHFINRELSWLDFNDRVLTLAEDDQIPLMERAKFLAIFAGNLDEFFMVRVAGIKAQQAAGFERRSPDGMTPSEQLVAISEKAIPMAQRHAELFKDSVMPALGKAGVDILRYDELDQGQSKELDDFFRKRVFPVLTPLAVDPAHPFPYISNLSLNLAVLVRDPSDDQIHFARVKVPPSLPRFVASTVSEGVFVPLEDVIAANLDKLFRGMQVVEHHTFRVTRNADVDIDDDGAEDLVLALEQELRRRRFSPAVRLETEQTMPDHVLDLLMRELQITKSDVFALPGPLDLSGLWELYGLERSDLKDESFQPAPHPALVTSDDSPLDIFEVLKRRDVLVHHPYDSFTTSVQHLIEQAAADPNVLAIKQTLYRTSGESPIVDALIDAAEAGKQVVVIVEIKARFDERANINWGRTLERAGCHVAYGLVGLKTHAKLALIVRQEGDRLQRYVHVGTGNYNPKTARLYEDIGLLTSNPALSADVTDLFNYLTGYSRQPRYRSMIVAPHGMRERMIALIEREADKSSAEHPGRVIMKMNALVDESIIDALYKASGVGVQIDLIVRGICGLRPGVPGQSENIRVRSILGRFLEHSRIYYFENGGDEDIYIGSPDMMHRNLDRRVESLTRIEDDRVKRRLRGTMDLALADNTSAWILGPDGVWTSVVPPEDAEPIDLQKELMRRTAVERDA